MESFLIWSIFYSDHRKLVQRTYEVRLASLPRFSSKLAANEKAFIMLGLKRESAAPGGAADRASACEKDDDVVVGNGGGGRGGGHRQRAGFRPVQSLPRFPGHLNEARPLTERTVRHVLLARNSRLALWAAARGAPRGFGKVAVGDRHHVGAPAHDHHGGVHGGHEDTLLAVPLEERPAEPQPDVPMRATVFPQVGVRPHDTQLVAVLGERLDGRMADDLPIADGDRGETELPEVVELVHGLREERRDGCAVDDDLRQCGCIGDDGEKGADLEIIHGGGASRDVSGADEGGRINKKATEGFPSVAFRAGCNVKR